MWAQGTSNRTGLSELLTLGAALSGVVAVGALALFAGAQVGLAVSRLTIILCSFTLGCAALAVGAHLFIRRIRVRPDGGVGVPWARGPAAIAFALTPPLLIAAHALPVGVGNVAYWTAVLACVSYGLGALAVLAHGARVGASRGIRAAYWCAMPVFVLFVTLIGYMVLVGPLG